MRIFLSVRQAEGCFADVSFGTPGGGMFCGCFFRYARRRNVFLRMFRFQKAGSSKFSAAGLVAADGPAPDALALLAAVSSGSGRRLLGTSKFFQDTVCVSPNPGY